jgi:hypothetical protein
MDVKKVGVFSRGVMTFFWRNFGQEQVLPPPPHSLVAVMVWKT